MSFRAKILLVLAFVGLLPVFVLGWLSFSVNRVELERTVGASQSEIAREAARSCERYLARGIDSLRLSVGVLPLEKLRNDELAAILRIPYRQLPFITAIALLDVDGRLLVPPVFERRQAGEGAPAGKPDAFIEEDVERFLRQVPLDLALQAGTALGTPYRGRTGATRLAVALRTEGAGRIVAAEFSLAELDRWMGEIAKGPSVAFLASQDGNVLARAFPGSELGDAERELVSSAVATKAPVVRMISRGKTEWLASAAPAGALGWAVVVAQPAAVAFRAADRVRLYTLFWAGVALLLIALLGALLSLSLSGPLRKLALGVRALGEGRYDEPVPVDSRDEFGELAEAFNRMSDEIRRRDEEIRGWNAELKKRVQERTEELKAAQDQILRARRLAAIGSLGAGIAHELNNPLTAISGIVSILRRQIGDGSPYAESLRTVQEQTRRVTKIVSDLRQFADQERASTGRKFMLAGAVKAALDLYAEQMQQHNIRLFADLGAGRCEAQGDPVQIQQMVAHLVANAIQAMPEGGELKVSLSDVAGDALKLTVSDTGKGIPSHLRERIFDPFFTTKDQQTGVGLGLSISHSIVEAHHGKILVDSAEGRGATFTVLLPAAPAAAHLS